MRSLLKQIAVFSLVFIPLMAWQSPLLWTAPTRITTDPADDEYVILTDSNAPAIGSAYPENSLLAVKAIGAVSAGGDQPMLWRG